LRKEMKKLVLSRETVSLLEGKTLKEILGGTNSPPPPPPRVTGNFQCWDEYIRA
jgi:hypothetical protein